jgi:nucleotide-binding universal stress UspA family protein
MNECNIPDMPLVESVFHPSDFSKASENAFAHALSVACLRKAKFTIFHAGGKLAGKEWSHFPAVRTTLERWGVLGKGSPRSAVFETLGVAVEKIDLPHSNPLKACLNYLEETPTDLIVLATEGREGLPQWIKRSVAEELALRTQTMTLFVPNASRGFVSSQDGELTLRKILIPVDHKPCPQAAVQFATRAAKLMGDEVVGITIVHVGDSSEMHDIDLPEDPSWSWKKLYRRGEVVDEIIKAANEVSADMIAMVTAGHEGILGALRGSTSEHVLRHSPCPLLAVPDAWVGKVARREV